MAKVKADFSRTFLWLGEEVNYFVALDVADDGEGYGVVIGDDITDMTIAFGQGELSYALASKLYACIATEMESYPERTEVSDIVFEYDELETLYCSEKDKVLSDYSYVKELKKIVDYIYRWYEE